MESVIERLVLGIEEAIRLDYEWLSTCAWSGITPDTKVPNRYSPSFIDMAMTRLVMKYGFAVWTRYAFEIDQYLNVCNSMPERV